jgi:protein-disulfide isomerase
MFRRFLVTSCRRTFLCFLIICLGCSAQLAPSDLAQRIERQLRVTYNVPATVKVSITEPKPSEFANYEAITVTFDGEGKKQNYEFLISKDQKTLVRLTRIDMSKDPYEEITKKIDIKGRPVRGNPNAKVMMVNYDDFECPFCSRVHQTLFPQLLKEYGDRVSFVYKDYPLSEIHPWAIHAAVDANCIASQNSEAYWDFADYIHANQQVVNKEANHDAQFAALDHIALNEGDKFKLDSAKLQACLKEQKNDAVTASLKEGDALGVTGTPTMFVNGQMLDGARSLAEIRALFDSALQRAGVTPPSHAPTASVGAATTQPSTPGATGAPQH